MEVTLVVARGKHAGQRVPVRGPMFLIGRDPECHLRPRSELVGVTVRSWLNPGLCGFAISAAPTGPWSMG